LTSIIGVRGDASIVELGIARMPDFENKIGVLPIPEEFFPPPLLTFTIGVMKDDRDRALADDSELHPLARRTVVLRAQRLHPGWIAKIGPRAKIPARAVPSLSIALKA
jgi:hypothetical protein